MRLLGFVVLTFVAGGVARAEDAWTDPAPGVRHLSRTTVSPAQRIHALFVDLDAPGVSLVATRRADRGRTVSSFAARVGAVAAVNGDFFEDDFSTEGLAMGEGEAWPGSSDGSKWGFLAAGGARAEISLPEVVGVPEPWMSEIVGGYPLLVDAGAVSPATACDTSFCRRNPRTAVGLDGRTLILVVVDGRESQGVGMSLAELAALMVDLGAERALNLDGGGSSAMFIAAEGGIVNQPSDGSERRVANHLAVRFSPPPVPVPVPVPVPDSGSSPAPLADPDSAVAGGCSVSDLEPAGHAATLLVAAWLLSRRLRT